MFWVGLTFWSKAYDACFPERTRFRFCFGSCHAWTIALAAQYRQHSVLLLSVHFWGLLGWRRLLGSACTRDSVVREILLGHLFSTAFVPHHTLWAFAIVIDQHPCRQSEFTPLTRSRLLAG